MRISNVKIINFRRFANLEVTDIPANAKLVMLAGPNGSGKSSFFDALLLKYRWGSKYGFNNDLTYYRRPGDTSQYLNDKIAITTHNDADFSVGSLYVRSAYRHDPEFAMNSLKRQGAVLDNFDLSRLIETDATVARNYARLASQAMEDVFVNENVSTTMGAYRERMIGEIRDPMKRLFPDLTFVSVGNPLDNGSFQFDKGTIKNFDYRNLSGGEKAAFDLILDMVVKRRSYSNAIYCIDEPETHINARVQGALLQELLALIPGESQLWIASHSIGMMRKARELFNADPRSVVFLDFGGRDFDQKTVISPEKPTRVFWEGVLDVALDDLATLVAPREVVICEGGPTGTTPGKNSEHDATVYSTIFGDEFPDVTFISAGSANQVTGDVLGLAAALPKVATGMRIRRLIDRDDHAPADIAAYQKAGITVLGRRNIEAYLYDDEVLTALCLSVGKAEDAQAVIAAKEKAILDVVARGKAKDDIKSAAGTIYNETKRILGLVAVGNTQMAFARNTLAPLIKPGMATYGQLKSDVFGK